MPDFAGVNLIRLYTVTWGIPMAWTILTFQYQLILFTNLTVTIDSFTVSLLKVLIVKKTYTPQTFEW